LAREIAAKRPGPLHFDFEAQEARDRLTEPALFLRQYENSLVVLDEIHRVGYGGGEGTGLCWVCGVTGR
jgi:hypothetical protein